MIHNKRSYKGRTEDALASGGDEGRGKLRKCAGICKQDLIRTYPNGTTRQVEDLTLINESQRGELKHLSIRRKRKKYRFPE